MHFHREIVAIKHMILRNISIGKRMKFCLLSCALLACSSHASNFTETHAVAVMTDGGNSGMQVRAWYGDISFSGR
jgi:hypothetical protein